MNNRQIARIARLAGAPERRTAGIDLHVHCGEWVERGQPIFTVYAEDRGNLEYVKKYLTQILGVVQIDSDPMSSTELFAESAA